MFGSFGNLLLSYDGPSIFLTIHVYRISVSWQKYEFTCNFTEIFIICTIFSMTD